MNTLRLQPTVRGSDDWVEIVLVSQPMDENLGGEFANNEDGHAEEPLAVGYIREVEGVEGWYDARVIDADGMLERRFPTYEGALLAMALRVYYDPDTRKLVGW